MSITSGSGGPFVAPPAPAPIQSGNYGTLGLVATLGPLGAGFTLINGTNNNVLSWTAPNDGLMHRALVYLALSVTSAETGGQINVTTPFGGISKIAIAASLANGWQWAGVNGLVSPGQAILVSQATALTAGAAVLYGEIWAS